MTDTIIFEVTPSRVRQAANVSAKRDLSTEQAAQFITLFHEEIHEAMTDAFRKVMVRHFGDASNIHLING